MGPRTADLISTTHSHPAGESARLVFGGLPPLRGSTMADKMLYGRSELDGLRGGLMLGPRGRQDMYGVWRATDAVFFHGPARRLAGGTLPVPSANCTYNQKRLRGDA